MDTKHMPELSAAQLALQQFIQELRDHFPADSGINPTGKSGGLILAADIIAGYDQLAAKLAQAEARCERLHAAADLTVRRMVDFGCPEHLKGDMRALALALLYDPAIQPAPSTAECAKCGGEGKRYIGWASTGKRPCPDCNGTGRTQPTTEGK